MPEPRRKPGYLLVELIAALTLVAIAVAALLPSVAGRSEAARRDEIVQRVIGMDRRARSAALRDGPVVLRTDPDRQTASLVLGAQNGDRLGKIALKGFDLYLLDAGSETRLDRVVTDRLGRTPDYRVLVRAEGWEASVGFVGTSGIASVQRPDGGHP